MAVSNSLLTTSLILDRALAVLFQEAVFLKHVNRQYDRRYFGSGAKYGDTISVRVPQRAVVRDGPVMNIQAQVDQTIPVTINGYKGVDTGATSLEMALDIDDYQAQFIDTKIPDLIAAIEQKAISTCLPLVYNEAGDYAEFDEVDTVLEAGAILSNNLAPQNGRCMIQNVNAQRQMVGALTGFYNPQPKISDQYESGLMQKNTLGFDWYSTTLMPTFTRGGANGSYLTAAGIATDGGSTLAVDTGSGTFVIGDVITIAGVNAVHPQTKADLGYLKEFVVTAASAGGTVTLSVSPSFYLTGPKQNITALPVDDVAVTIKGAASTLYQQSLAFVPDAFYFVTADLPMPKGMGVDCAQKTVDGLTLRFMNGFDITNDQFVSRFDIAFGAGALRPELACRILNTP